MFSFDVACFDYQTIPFPTETFSLASVCPQLRPGALEYTENDVYQSSHLTPTWETKTINLGLGVAALLDETLNSSIFLAPSSATSAVWRRRTAIDCTFEVTTGPESRGIYVVLSQLSELRRWFNGSCQDYLRINYANFYSHSICDPVGQPGESILSFDSSTRSVKVHLHLEDGVGDQRNLGRFQMRLKLVLTSYFDCAKEREGFSCTSTNERCIPKEYVRDGVHNCGVPTCRDEMSCLSRGEDRAEEMYDNLSITILIGLVSFISTGLLFGLLLWVCLKRNFKQRLTGNSTPSLGMELTNVYETGRGGGNNNNNNNNRRTSAGEAVAGGSGSTGDGGAVGGGTADPPPSYDILFPGK